jgi:hypothetical protein
MNSPPRPCNAPAGACVRLGARHATRVEPSLGHERGIRSRGSMHMGHVTKNLGRQSVWTMVQCVHSDTPCQGPILARFWEADGDVRCCEASSLRGD